MSGRYDNNLHQPPTSDRSGPPRRRHILCNVESFRVVSECHGVSGDELRVEGWFPSHLFRYAGVGDVIKLANLIGDRFEGSRVAGDLMITTFGPQWIADIISALPTSTPAASRVSFRAQRSS